MSHFTVLVIGDDPEKQLAPYQENNMGDCPKEYLKFFSVEEEYRKEYEEDKMECVRYPDGKLIDKYSKKAKQFWKRNGIGISTADEFILPEGYELTEVPFKEFYPTFDNFIQDWAGYKDKDEETGEYGYWENPNRKWDWNQLGGRWAGFLKLKEGAKGELGRSGVFGNEAKEGWVDQARKKDIDFEGMMKEAAEEAAEEYDEFAEATRGILPPKPWNEFREEYNSIDEARKVYNDLPFIKALKKFTYFGDPVTKFKLYEDNPRLAYIEEKSKSAFVPFAIVFNGKWYERGKMGWWAMVHDEKDKDEWLNQVYTLLTERSDDTLLSVFDCHI